MKTFLKNKYQVLDGRKISFPKWSFYDAVHYTDYGSEEVGRFYVEAVNNLFEN